MSSDFMSSQFRLAHFRIGTYFLLTAIVFLLSLVPEALLAFFLIYTVIYSPIVAFFTILSSPGVFIILYFVSCVVFGLAHSQIVVRLTLPSLQEGVFDHHTGSGRIMAVRLTCSNVFQSMIGALKWIPHLHSIFFQPYLLRLYGLRTYSNVHMSTTMYVDTGLVEIGDNSFFGFHSAVTSHLSERRKLIIKRTRIGKNVTVGAFTIVSPGATIGDNVMVGAHSFVKKDQEIPSNTVWAGVPARQIYPKSGSSTKPARFLDISNLPDIEREVTAIASSWGSSLLEEAQERLPGVEEFLEQVVSGSLRTLSKTREFIEDSRRKVDDASSDSD